MEKDKIIDIEFKIICTMFKEVGFNYYSRSTFDKNKYIWCTNDGPGKSKLSIEVNFITDSDDMEYVVSFVVDCNHCLSTNLLNKKEFADLITDSFFAIKKEGINSFLKRLEKVYESIDKKK